VGQRTEEHSLKHPRKSNAMKKEFHKIISGQHIRVARDELPWVDESTNSINPERVESIPHEPFVAFDWAFDSTLSGLEADIAKVPRGSSCLATLG